MSDTKECPFCCEEIKGNAIKCKHCGERLDEDSSNLQPLKEKKMKDEGMAKSDMDDYGHSFEIEKDIINIKQIEEGDLVEEETIKISDVDKVLYKKETKTSTGEAFGCLSAFIILAFVSLCNFGLVGLLVSIVLLIGGIIFFVNMMSKKPYDELTISAILKSKEEKILGYYENATEAKKAKKELDNLLKNNTKK